MEATVSRFPSCIPPPHPTAVSMSSPTACAGVRSTSAPGPRAIPAGAGEVGTPTRSRTSPSTPSIQCQRLPYRSPLSPKGGVFLNSFTWNVTSLSFLRTAYSLPLSRVVGAPGSRQIPGLCHHVTESLARKRRVCGPLEPLWVPSQPLSLCSHRPARSRPRSPSVTGAAEARDCHSHTPRGPGGLTSPRSAQLPGLLPTTRSSFGPALRRGRAHSRPDYSVRHVSSRAAGILVKRHL